MAYIDIAYLGLVGTIPHDEITQYSANNPGVVDAICESVSRMFDARLHKRYATPFQEPYPEVLRFHVAQVVSFQLAIKIGFEPGSAKDEQIKAMRDEALAWLKEAADSQAGTVELPPIETPVTGDGTAVSRSRPHAYSESTPYQWARLQAQRARNGAT